MTDQLTAAGLELDDLTTREDSIIAELRATIGANINAGTDTPEGQLVKILAERIQSIAELIQYVHQSQYPDNAVGVSLDGIASIIGITRLDATKSYVIATVNVDPGTYVAGTLKAAVYDDPSSQFVNFADVENITGSAQDIPAPFIAVNAGITYAYAGTLTVIVDAVAGWNSVTNAADATLGTAEENDNQLRDRIYTSHVSGNASVDGIRNALMEIDGMRWAAVYENDTDDWDSSDTMPPHSIRVIVEQTGVSAATIASTIFEKKPCSVRTTPSASYQDIVDSSGESRRIYFEYATITPMYLEIDLTVNDAVYDGDVALAEAIASYADETFGVGETVSIPKIIHGAFTEISGIADISEIRVGRTSSPTQTTSFDMGAHERGDLDSTRIVVTSTSV